MGMKDVANATDRVHISNLRAAGKSFEENSYALAIEKGVISRFVEDAEAEGTEKPVTEPPPAKEPPAVKTPPVAGKGGKSAKDEFKEL